LSTPIGAAADIDEVFALSPACSSPKAFILWASLIHF
jgi:hypothetical protein